MLENRFWDRFIFVVWLSSNIFMLVTFFLPVLVAIPFGWAIVLGLCNKSIIVNLALLLAFLPILAGIAFYIFGLFKKTPYTYLGIVLIFPFYLLLINYDFFGHIYHTEQFIVIGNAFLAMAFTLVRSFEQDKENHISPYKNFFTICALCPIALSVLYLFIVMPILIFHAERW